jgi:hypothetical protein
MVSFMQELSVGGNSILGLSGTIQFARPLLMWLLCIGTPQASPRALAVLQAIPFVVPAMLRAEHYRRLLAVERVSVRFSQC